MPLWNTPAIKNQRIAIGMGVGLIVLGMFCLHDAWEVRGVKQPAIMRWIGMPGL